MPKVTAADLRAAIEKVHPAPEWACLFEVANQTGVGDGYRYADAIAMCLWPSRGLVIRGFEIKVSRADLRRESNDPAKAESIAKYCDEWWIVTPPGLVQDIDTELPPAWGLMMLNKHGGLKTVRKAIMTKATPITRKFLAAMLRRAHQSLAKNNKDWIHKTDVAEKIAAAVKLGESRVPCDISHAQKRVDHLQEVIAKWHEATGIDLTGDKTWRLGDIDRHVQRYCLGQLLLGRSKYFDGVTNVLKLVKQARDKMDVVVAKLDKLQPDEVEGKSTRVKKLRTIIIETDND